MSQGDALLWLCVGLMLGVLATFGVIGLIDTWIIYQPRKQKRPRLVDAVVTDDDTIEWTETREDES